MNKLPPIKELRKICQPKEPDVTPLAITYRSISIYITRLFLYTPITPNQITLLGALIYIAGASLFISGSPLMIIIGGLVVRLAILLDYVDGSVARYRGIASPGGDFLDKLSDCVPQILLFIFLSFGVYQNYPHLLVFAIGCVATMSIVLKTLTGLCQDSALLKVVLKQELQTRHKTSKAMDSCSSSFLRYPYHTVDLFIGAAVIDLVLAWGFPSIIMPFSIVLATLSIYGVFSLVSAIVGIVHIMQTGGQYES